jgi:ankyrin repeat protein
MIEATKLEYWASLGRLDRVAEVLEANPDVNVCGIEGYTALHAAAENGHLKVIQFLIGRGASLNPRVESGETPLDLATQAGQHKAVELLRSIGAGQHAEIDAAADGGA